MRVRLRPVERRDLEWLVLQRNIPEHIRMFNQPVDLSMDDEVEWYEKKVLQKKVYAYLVYLDNIRIGYAALQNINWIVRSAEVSHFIINEINPDLALCVHDLILDIAFRTLNLNRVHSVCFNHNPIFERLKELGFKSEGTLRQSCYKDNKLGDSQMIAVLKDEWKTLQEVISKVEKN